MLHKKTARSQLGAGVLLLFGGNHIVVHRLAAREKSDLGAGAGGGENLFCLLGLLLGDILPVKDGDEFGALMGLRLGQPLQDRGQVPVGAKELVFLQSQIVPLVDGEAVKKIGRASCRERVSWYV